MKKGTESQEKKRMRVMKTRLMAVRSGCDLVKKVEALVIRRQKNLISEEQFNESMNRHLPG